MINVGKVDSEFMPEGANPFNYDAYSMGTRIAKNVMVMYPTHPNEKAGMMYIVNIETGERVTIKFCDDDYLSMTGHMMDNPFCVLEV